jgi:hypothetical protein
LKTIFGSFWNDKINVWIEKLRVIRLKGQKSTKYPTATDNRKCLSKLGKTSLSSKRCNILDDKHQKKLRSIKTTGILKAMKDVLAKAQRLTNWVNFFASNVSTQIMNKTLQILSQFFVFLKS